MTAPEPEITYEYRSRPWIVLGIILLFGLLTAVFGKLGSAPLPDGLSAADRRAAQFGWVPFGLCALFFLLSLVIAVKRVVLRQRLVLGATGLTVPASAWSHAEKTIAYGDIRWLGESKMYGQRMVTIDHPGGSLTIAASMLPKGDGYDTILRRLRAKATNLVR